MVVSSSSARRAPKRAPKRPDISLVSPPGYRLIATAAEASRFMLECDELLVELVDEARMHHAPAVPHVDLETDDVALICDAGLPPWIKRKWKALAYRFSLDLQHVMLAVFADCPVSLVGGMFDRRTEVRSDGTVHHTFDPYHSGNGIGRAGGAIRGWPRPYTAGYTRQSRAANEDVVIEHRKHRPKRPFINTRSRIDGSPFRPAPGRTRSSTGAQYAVIDKRNRYWLPARVYRELYDHPLIKETVRALFKAMRWGQVREKKRPNSPEQTKREQCGQKLRSIKRAARNRRELLSSRTIKLSPEAAENMTVDELVRRHPHLKNTFILEEHRSLDRDPETGVVRLVRDRRIRTVSKGYLIRVSQWSKGEIGLARKKRISLPPWRSDLQKLIPVRDPSLPPSEKDPCLGEQKELAGRSPAAARPAVEVNPEPRGGSRRRRRAILQQKWTAEAEKQHFPEKPRPAAAAPRPALSDDDVALRPPRSPRSKDAGRGKGKAPEGIAKPPSVPAGAISEREPPLVLSESEKTWLPRLRGEPSSTPAAECSTVPQSDRAAVEQELFRVPSAPARPPAPYVPPGVKELAARLAVDVSDPEQVNLVQQLQVELEQSSWWETWKRHRPRGPDDTS